MDVDVAEERRSVKRAATMEVVPSSSPHVSVSQAEPSHNIPLSQLSYQGVSLFNVTEIFDLQKPELGRGVAGVVYKGTVSTQHELRAHLPPWLKTGDAFAIKVSTVTLPTKDQTNVTEAQINLLVAQSADMPKDNIIRCLYWMRAINDIQYLVPTPLSMCDVTVMELATGGSLQQMFRTDQSFDALVRSNMNNSFMSLFAQYVAGIAALSFVLSNFQQIDVHTGNIFCKRVANPTYFIYGFGDGMVLLAPTWFTNNCIIALGDFGAAYGIAQTTEGGQTVGRMMIHYTDYNRVAHIITEQYSEIDRNYTQLVKKTYKDLLLLLDSGGAPAAQLAPYAAEIRAQKAAEPTYWILISSGVWQHQKDYVEGAKRLIVYIDALQQQTIVPSSSLSIPSASSYSDVASIVDRLKQARAPLLLFHESYMALRKAHAFGQTGGGHALYVLRHSPMFEELRTTDDPTSISALLDKLLLPGMNKDKVEPTRVELKPPPDRPKVDYVHGRLQ